MVMYIDPTMNAAGFGDVQNAMLTLDATVEAPSGGGGPSFPPALSLVPPSGSIVAAKLPGWVLVAAFVAFLLLVNDRRTA